MKPQLINKRFKFTCWILFLTSLLTLSAQATAEEWIYTIRPGDNLWNVSERHLTSMQYVSRLQQLNRVPNAYTIPPGTKIRIPVAWSKQHTEGVYARVVNIHGTAMLTRVSTAENVPVELGMPLYAGDEIKSENDAFVTVEFPDKSRMRLQDNSHVRINEMKVFGDYGLVDTLIELQQGRTENSVLPKSEIGTRFRIKTPSAVSSVRGTDFRVGTLTNGTDTSSEVLTGLVQVSGGQKAINVSAGFGTVTALSAPPSPPVKLLPPPDLTQTSDIYERLPLIITLPALAGASAYRAQIAKDQNFDAMWSEFTTAKLPFRDGDIPDGDYWLRVRGIDATGIEGRDAIMSFTLNARPEPPFVIMPLPDGVVDPIAREFQWAAQSEAAHYIVMVSQNPAFSTTIVHDTKVTDNKFRLIDPLSPGQYFWRIASVSAIEGAGPFSDAMTFRMPFPGPAMEETKFD
ncbi:MAG: FecR domain-containing protein, partial [Nitrosomonas sp.]|uniref:FecR domain-containing protein n=1 Tax=Nitrosomonas sp. TaxID=42353 RepID=UPI00273525E5